LVSLAALPLSRAFAQGETGGQVKPLMVMSIASPDELLGDISYLTEVAGVGDVGRLVALMASPFTAGMEKGQPMGAYATMPNPDAPDQLEAIGFVPVKDLKLLLASLEQQVGKPREAGDGVLEIASDRPQPMFVKEQGGWAFVSNKKSVLGSLPQKPAELLGDLPRRFTVALQVNVANIPANIRNMAIEQMRRGFEEGLDRSVGNEQQTKLAKDLGENWLKSIISLVEEAQHLTVGWQVDGQNKQTALEISLTAQEGTKLAAEMALIQPATSAFAGFLMPEAAANMVVVSPVAESDVQQALALLAMARTEAMKGIDKDNNLASDEERGTAKGIVGKLLDVVEETVKDAKVDVGGCLVLKPGAMTLAAGGFVDDGQKLAEVVKELHAFAQKKDARTPDVKFDAETYRDVVFHMASLPLRNADANARLVLGDPLEVVVGTGKSSAYLALGRNAADLLKKVLDKSAEDAQKKLPPLQMRVALGSILDFASSLDSNPALPALAEAIKSSQGQDHVSVLVEPIADGVAVRMVIEEGVVAAIGEAARSLAPGMQGRRAPRAAVQ
jgi:hypothetical protein